MNDRGDSPIPLDRRCPRKLRFHPDSFCPLAVMRLKAIRTASKEITEDEESKLPGCPWALNHQMSNYCYFKYMKEYGDNKQLSDVEVAGLLNISVDTVKKTEAKAIAKVKNTELIKQLEGSSDPIVNDNGGGYTILR